MTTTTKAKTKSWQEKLAESWYQLKVADHGAQLEKDLRRQRLVERLVKKTQDGTVGQTTSEPMDSEDDTVSVGNEINHYHQPTQPQSSLPRTVAALGLAAAGLGAGISAPILAYNWSKPDNVEQTTTIEDGREYGLRIVRPETNGG